MKTLLRIDSSVRRTDNPVAGHNSISKQMGDRFIQQWMNSDQPGRLLQRDLGLNPPGFISQDWIASVFTPPAQRSAAQQALLEESDRYIEELDQADLILLTAPMYNYGMPAVLKAWFDQVVRINKTFSFDLARGDFPLEPIMSGKTLVLISSSGEFGFEPGGIREEMNHLGTHIQVLGKYLGVEQFYEVRVEYQEFGDQRHQDSLRRAQKDIDELVAGLTR